MSERNNQMAQPLGKGCGVCKETKEADLVLLLMHCGVMSVSTMLTEGQRKSFLF